MRTRLALLFPLLLIPNATSPSLPADEAPIAVQSTDRQDLEIERALAGMISEVRMQETVRQLCAFGPRMGGTSSGDAAAQWLAGTFSQAGLEVEIHDQATQSKNRSLMSDNLNLITDRSASNIRHSGFKSKPAAIARFTQIGGHGDFHFPITIGLGLSAGNCITSE